ncbi:hypothetical protein V1288_003801 [Bradyrhizobium sp. AZCC 2176]
MGAFMFGVLLGIAFFLQGYLYFLLRRNHRTYSQLLMECRALRVELERHKNLQGGELWTSISEKFSRPTTLH